MALHLCIIALLFGLFRLNMPHNNTYEKRIVCFIDILGFSRLIKETTKSGEEGQKALDSVCSAMSLIRTIGNIVGERLELKGAIATQFSDSIVISFPWRKEDTSLLVAFAAIKHMQVLLIKNYRILLRGGVVIGDLIHTNSCLVGPAMVSAYELESKCAVSPRIVIDPKVAYRYRSLLKKWKKEWEGDSVINKDLDDTSYIDYFNVNDGDIVLGAEERKDYFKTLCTMVANNVESSDMSIRIKYLWMRNKIKHSLLFQQEEYAAIYKEFVTNRSLKRF